MNLLEEELSVAISAEMGETTKPDPVDVTDVGESDQQSDEPTEDEADAGEVENDREQGHDPAPEPRTKRNEGSARGLGTITSVVMTPLTAPVESLPAGGRLVLNFVAISFAFWVPVVWLGAMTNGFGYLTPTQEDQAGIVTPGTELWQEDFNSDPTLIEDQTDD